MSNIFPECAVVANRTDFISHFLSADVRKERRKVSCNYFLLALQVCFPAAAANHAVCGWCLIVAVCILRKYEGKKSIRAFGFGDRTLCQVPSAAVFRPIINLG